MSWIHIADLLRIIETVIDEPGWRGAVNAVAPGARAPGRISARAARALPSPVLAAHSRRARCALRMGEMAELLVEGQRVAPRRLLNERVSSSATSRWRARCAT